MSKKCELCHVNEAKELKDTVGVLEEGESIDICKSCLLAEIRFFLQGKDIDDSTYENAWIDPHFTIETDAYLNRNIFELIKLKLFNRGR